MAFLTVNGVTVSVALDSVSLRTVNAGGEEERSPSGSLEGGPLTDKREWSMATTPVLASEADAWRGLIEGKGQSWPFNTSLYGSRGRGPAYAATAVIVTGSAKHGAGHLRVGVGDAVLYDVYLPSTWTALLWRLESGVWRHYVVTSTGKKWKDGVRNDALVTSAFVNVASGQLQVGDLGGATGIRDFDDVVAFPYVVPDSWGAALYAQHNAAAWSALPRVLAAGDFASASVTVRGKAPDSRVLRYAPSGTPTNGHTIQFTLREV